MKMIFPWAMIMLLAASAMAAEAGPNIILIMADDLGYGSLGCYGSKEIKTPHIDRLAANGMRFSDFHSNGAMCSPTRAALMTGRYQQRCAWVPDEELSPAFREQRKENPAQRWAWGISMNELTIAELLQQNGYRSGIIEQPNCDDHGFFPDLREASRGNNPSRLPDRWHGHHATHEG